MASTSEPSSTAIDAETVVARSAGYRFDGNAAIGPFDFSIRSGTVTAIVGPNGSGKSTLLELVAGRLRPTSGSLKWRNEDVPRDIGYAAQHVELDPEMHGAELLRLFAMLEKIPRGVRKTAIDEAIARFALAGFVDRRVSTLSGGMRRRLHLAISTLGAPALWLLDEPTTGLDREATLALDSAIRETAPRTVVVATHDVDFVERIATEVLVLSRGVIVATGTVTSLRDAHGSLDAALRNLAGEPVASERRGRRRRHG